MNITSVGGQELYRILFGREVESQMIISDEDKAKITSTGRERLFDELVLSKEYKNDPDTSSVISLFETGGKLYSFGMKFNFFNDNKSFANYFADIGKRLDEAYAEGKFTEDEYNELNAGLTEYITYMKDKNDVWRAKREMISSNWNSGHVNVMTGNAEKDKQTMDEFNAVKKNAIDKILNRKGFRTDINVIMEMINKLRYGANFQTANIVEQMLGNK